MTMPAPRPRSARQAFAPREFATGSVARPGIAGLCWRWRYEIGAVALIGYFLTVAGPISVATVLLTGATLIAAWPALRRTAIDLAWCVITAHRVRTGCAQAWIHSRSGKIPVVLRTSRRPFGQRVLLWCRAGTSPEDFTWGGHLIAAACWAREIRVTRHERYAHLVVLDVIRRPEGGIRLAPVEPLRLPGDQGYHVGQRLHDQTASTAPAKAI